MARTERPRKAIDKKMLQDLCCMGFYKETIADFFDVSAADIDDFCKEEYGDTFDEIVEQIEYARHINQDKERPYTVYMHIAPNGKKYIGITRCTLNRRWGNGKGYWSNDHFTNAINCYGWDNIQHAILYMRLTKEEAEQKERELIKRFRTTDKRYGYNIEGGGSLGKEVSELTREKLRQRSTGVYPSEATRQKMRESHQGEKCHFYGKHLSEGRKQRLRELKSKAVVQMDADWNIVNKYSSMKEAAEAVGRTRQAITIACNKGYSKCAGYHWRWLDGQTESAN